jgi:hypothetical protein
VTATGKATIETLQRFEFQGTRSPGRTPTGSSWSADSENVGGSVAVGLTRALTDTPCPETDPSAGCYRPQDARSRSGGVTSEEPALPGAHHCRVRRPGWCVPPVPVQGKDGEPMMADDQQPAQVVVGVDTHDQVHVAAVVDRVGRELGHQAFATTRPAMPSCWPGRRTLAWSGWLAWRHRGLRCRAVPLPARPAAGGGGGGPP